MRLVRLLTALALSALPVTIAKAGDPSKGWDLRTYKYGFIQAVSRGSEAYISFYCSRMLSEDTRTVSIEVFPHNEFPLGGKADFIFTIDGEKIFTVSGDSFKNGYQIRSPGEEFIQAMRKGKAMTVAVPTKEWTSLFQLKGSGKAIQSVRDHCDKPLAQTASAR